eukprot:7977243-Karenia_brevis.AAC.1
MKKRPRISLAGDALGLAHARSAEGTNRQGHMAEFVGTVAFSCAHYRVQGPSWRREAADAVGNSTLQQKRLIQAEPTMPCWNGRRS